MAKDDEFWSQSDIDKLIDDLIRLTGAKEHRAPKKESEEWDEGYVTEAEPSMAWLDWAREDYVKKKIKEMAEKGTYSFITDWYQSSSGPVEGKADWKNPLTDIEDEEGTTSHFDKREYKGSEKHYDPTKEISDEIKDQFVGDDWKYILPFKWFGE